MQSICLAEQLATDLTETNNKEDWRWQMRNRAKTISGLYRMLPGLRDQKNIKSVIAMYPMAITPYYASLIRTLEDTDPIFKQCVPQAEELTSPGYCASDPLQEEEYSPVPHLIHRYKDRALSMVSFTCPMYCRHCTRKRLAGIKEGFISKSDLEDQLSYLKKHEEIREIIISGGDPLTMSTERIECILSAFRSVPMIKIIRIGTRAPVTLPMRITDELCSMLKKHHPVWICTHFNHPREVTPESTAACEKLLMAGVPVLNQTVLLKGINDTVEIMEELYRALLSIRVRPYYLYQCDLVRGVEHFRTPLARGVEIAEALRDRISGIGLPQFIVDTPEGGGKIPVSPNRIVETHYDHTLLRGRNREIIKYPEPFSDSETADTTDSSTVRDSQKPRNKIALVFNEKKLPISISDSEAEFDFPETIDIIAASIEALGHKVIRLEADAELPMKLAKTKPDLVFNIAESSGSRGREGHVPALCEMMGIEYTGSDQTALAVALDKALTKTVLMQHGIPTPPFQLIRSMREIECFNLKYPVIVKPNHEGSSKGLLPDSVARTPEETARLVARVLTQYKQPAIIEECLMGREFTVGLIGAGEPEALPILEIRFTDPTRAPIYDIELKQDPPDKVQHLCPAPITTELAEEITTLARRAFHALSCRDICRVDIRLDAAGRPQVLEINPLPGLAPRYSDICKMTETLGWSHSELTAKIIAPALARRKNRLREERIAKE